MSYSSDLKEYLENIEIKKQCCVSAYEAGKTAAESGNVCENDPHCYLRGLFVGYGSITDPKKQYLVSFPEKVCDVAEDVMIQCGLFPLRTTRRGKEVVYLRESDAICDFLTVIGASKYSLELMETVVYKSVKCDANRRINAEIANLDKTATAAAEVCDAIDVLRSHKDYAKLPESLRETAVLRKEYPELSLDELREKHSMPISKSGLNHRLKKLVELSKKYKQ